MLACRSISGAHPLKIGFEPERSMRNESPFGTGAALIRVTRGSAMPRTFRGNQTVPLEVGIGLPYLPVWGLKMRETAVLDVAAIEVDGPRLSPSKPPPNR